MRPFACVFAAGVALRIVPLPRLLGVAHRPVRGPAIGEAGIRDLVRWVDRAGRYVPGGTCLARSLALVWLLRRRGIAAELRIGVNTDDGFLAHAWVERDGAALSDPQRIAERYAAFTSLRGRP
jgi:hypothetical protein